MRRCPPNRFAATVETVTGTSVTYTLPELLTVELIGTKCVRVWLPDPELPITGQEQVIINVGGTAINAVAPSCRFGEAVNVPAQRLRKTCGGGASYVFQLDFMGAVQVARFVWGLRPQVVVAVTA